MNLYITDVILKICVDWRVIFRIHPKKRKITYNPGRGPGSACEPTTVSR